MRMMVRNKSKFFYALYKEKVPKTDEYGNVTGEYEIIRDNPVEFSANISAAKGETSTRQFGESESYDKVIVMGTDAPLLTSTQCYGSIKRHRLMKPGLWLQMMMVRSLLLTIISLRR